MIDRSMCCFSGISAEAERKLWRAGCLSWDGVAAAERVVSPGKANTMRMELPFLRAALEGGVADYFLRRLPVGYRMRLLPDFVTGTGFLDVETTGLGRQDQLTVIGVWRNGVLRQYVQGHDIADFLREWRRIEVLVTYNGLRFDWPMLARQLGLACMPPHIDLMVEARVHGAVGGLKDVERMLGISRTDDEVGNGAEAVRLWYAYRQAGDCASLAKLLRYNARDVMSLVALSVWLWRRSMDTYSGPMPSLPMELTNEYARSLKSESLHIPPTG